MTTDVFTVMSSPAARGDKKQVIEKAVKNGIDASLLKNAGKKVVALNVAADINPGGFQTALVTIIYDGEDKPATKSK